ncbi:MAG: lanthionine synthetase C family protein [Bacteroidota bacterium]
MHWSPVANNTLAPEVTNKVKQIAQSLYELDEETLFNNISLMGGSSGVALFFIYYAQVFEDEAYFDKAVEIIQRNSEIIFNQENSMSFSFGLAGFTWFLKHIQKEELVDIEADEMVEVLERFLATEMIKQIRVWNYDYLHGALGIALYFLSANSHLDLVREVIKSIKDHAITDKNGGIKWEYYTNGELQPEEYNLGLSHGIPSIIAFLTKAYQKDINKETCLELINGGIEYLMQVKNDGEQHDFYWPYSIKENSPKDESRLAWCYGDLGLSMSLLNAAQITGNKALYDKVKAILLEVSERRDIHKNQIWDACFCHGSAGAAYIFQKAYHITQEPSFKQASQYWLTCTLDFSRHEGGYAGFKTYVMEDGYRNVPGLLEGVAGIGLSLLASLSEEGEGWDECFLL